MGFPLRAIFDLFFYVIMMGIDVGYKARTNIYIYAISTSYDHMQYQLLTTTLQHATSPSHKYPPHHLPVRYSPHSVAGCLSISQSPQPYRLPRVSSTLQLTGAANNRMAGRPRVVFVVAAVDVSGWLAGFRIIINHRSPGARSTSAWRKKSVRELLRQKCVAF